MCLWALSEYRSVALRLATPALRPLARRMVAAAAAIRYDTAGDATVLGCDDDACRHP